MVIPPLCVRPHLEPRGWPQYPPPVYIAERFHHYVARGVALKSRLVLLPTDPDDPCEEWVQRRLVSGEATRSQGLVFLTPALALHYGVSVCVIPVRGKATAYKEPASVTDEKPARNSAGRGGPVDYALPS